MPITSHSVSVRAAAAAERRRGGSRRPVARIAASQRRSVGEMDHCLAVTDASWWNRLREGLRARRASAAGRRSDATDVCAQLRRPVYVVYRTTRIRLTKYSSRRFGPFAPRRRRLLRRNLLRFFYCKLQRRARPPPSSPLRAPLGTTCSTASIERASAVARTARGRMRSTNRGRPIGLQEQRPPRSVRGGDDVQDLSCAPRTRVFASPLARRAPRPITAQRGLEAPEHAAANAAGW